MKIRNYFLMLAIAGVLASCGGETKTETTTTPEPTQEEVVETPTTPEGEEVTLIADVEQSNVRWEGNMTGAKSYSHFGNIAIQEGTISVIGDQITGGNFVIDMKTINPTDKAYSGDHTPEKLVGHLSTGDFFLVEEYPTASFTIKSVEGNVVHGDLTIRGITKPETIDIENITNNNDTVTATGKMVFDRQEFEVAYQNAAKDLILADDIALDITLVATK